MTSLPPHPDDPPEANVGAPDTHDATAAALTALADQIKREHERAIHREQVIDRLHAENQELRHGVLQEALNPVRSGLYRLYDMVNRESVRWRGPDQPSPEHVGALLEAITEEVAEVLARTGADRLPVTPGDTYNSALHRPVRTEPVGMDRDGTIVALMADGFQMGERVLRKAAVVIGKVNEGNQ